MSQVRIEKVADKVTSVSEITDVFYFQYPNIMHSFLIVLVSVLFTISSMEAQTCGEFDISLHTQTEVDEFPINYPGCTEIIGSLNIGDNNQTQDPILNLDSLSQLTILGKDFNIVGTDSLTSLEGLNQLTSVERFFRISDNEALSDLTALSNLVDADYLTLSDNRILENLAGLESLDSLSLLRITGNENLRTISNLNSLEYVNSFSIINNDLLDLDTDPIPLTATEFFYLFRYYGANSLNTLANLTYVGNYFNIEETSLTHLEGLEQLHTVGILEILSNEHLSDISALSNLQVLSQLYIDYTNPSLTSLDGLESLTVIDSTVYLDSRFLFDYSGLENVHTVGGDLTLRLDYPVMDSIFTDLQIIEGKLDLQGNFLQAVDLSDVRGTGRGLRLANNGMLTNLNLLANFDSVGLGDIILENLNGIQNMEGLTLPHEINGSLKITGASSLEYIHSSPTLKVVRGDLFINSSPSLTSLTGLDSLYSLEGLYIAATSLADLSGLENLQNVYGGISVANNPSLYSIEALQNVDASLLYTTNSRVFKIINNNNLRICEIEPVCEVIQNQSQELQAYGNAPGCGSPAEVENACMRSRLGGYVFYDFNQNNTFDAQEAAVPNARISLLPDDLILFTDADGFYSVLGDSSEFYEISFLEAQEGIWEVVSDTVYNFTFLPGEESNLAKNFALYRLDEAHTGTIALASDPTRCNTQVNFYLRYSNSGTFLEEGEVRLNYDPTTTYVTASPTPAEIDTDNHTLTWVYNELYPLQVNDINLTLAMPDENATGEPLAFTTSMWGLEQGSLTFFDTFLYEEVVLCSYDPNDKIVNPMGVQEDNYTLHDQTFTYTVRFQNTGNAEAINISIHDTLSPYLDLATFRVINSSFPVQTSLQENAIEFYFQNIWLPDSTSNEPASHGFVTYQIDPVAGLEDYSVIENTALIVFDFNPPIVTNTTANTMVTTIPVNRTSEIEPSLIKLVPNPVSDRLSVCLPDNQIPESVDIYDQLGQKKFSGHETEINIKAWATGIYSIIVHSEGKYYTGRFVKQ